LLNFLVYISEKFENFNVFIMGIKLNAYETGMEKHIHYRPLVFYAE